MSFRVSGSSRGSFSHTELFVVKKIFCDMPDIFRAASPYHLHALTSRECVPCGDRITVRGKRCLVTTRPASDSVPFFHPVLDGLFMSSVGGESNRCGPVIFREDIPGARERPGSRDCIYILFRSPGPSSAHMPMPVISTVKRSFHCTMYI